MATRRRFGSVRRLPSGRWQARYWDAAGNRLTAPTTFATKTDAQRWLSAAETDMARGDWHDPRLGDLPFGGDTYGATGVIESGSCFHVRTPNQICRGFPRAPCTGRLGRCQAADSCSGQSTRKWRSAIGAPTKAQ